MPRLRCLAVLALCAACAGATTNLAGEVTYAKDAKGNFDKGTEALKDHDYADAISYFQYVKQKFPYSRYAPLAELKMADANFDQDKFTEAIDAYKNFIKDHPTNPDADYAGFRIGLSHYKDIPSDFFLVPPSYEKDQQQLRDAQSSIKDFLSSYPASSHADEGKKILADIRERLARHELYVAQFYQTHGHPKAAAWRYEGLVRDYGDTPFAAEARKESDRIYQELGPGARPPTPETLTSHPTDVSPALR